MRKSFMGTSRLFRSLVAALAAFPLIAVAQVYKWTDAQGRVSYGNNPPPGARNVTRVDEDSGRVTTVPGMPREQIDAQRERATQQRADDLQRQLDAQRRAGQAQTPAPVDQAAAYQRWREQCLAERRVDCDDPSRGAMYDSGGTAWYPTQPYPPVVRPPIARPPNFNVPQQPVQTWPNNPNGPVVASPPAKQDPREVIQTKPQPRAGGATY